MSDEPPSEVRPGQRIAKAMARAGLCSRRDAEALIAAGRVTVNGKALASPAYNVTEADDIRVDGEPLAPIERTRLFLFHKPRGLVTTARDPEGRPTIFAALPPGLPRLVAVGRLDINSEGLLLLTNDGGLARVLELPSTGWLRRYRVRAHGSIDEARLAALSEGVTVDGVHYAGIEAKLDREQGSNVWLTMGLREGKNREIKKVLDHLGLSVTRLIRVSFGPFELGDLAEGEVAEVRTRHLRDQLGPKLSKEAKANFDAPMVERPAAEPADDRGRARAPEGRERAEKRSESRPRSASREPRGGAIASSPRRGLPAPSTPERKRKHVSALRAQIAASASGPRKRIERSATQDRKGRSVAVERIAKAGAETADNFEMRPRTGKSRGSKPARFSDRASEKGREQKNRAPKSGRLSSGGRTTGGKLPERRSGAAPAAGARFDRSGGPRRKSAEDHETRRSLHEGAGRLREKGGHRDDGGKPHPAGKPRRPSFRGGDDSARAADRKPPRRDKPGPGHRPPRGGQPQGPRRPPRKR